MLRKFIEETPALVSIIILPVILWSIIFVIEYLIGYFMSPIMVGANMVWWCSIYDIELDREWYREMKLKEIGII